MPLSIALRKNNTFIYMPMSRRNKKGGTRAMLPNMFSSSASSISGVGCPYNYYPTYGANGQLNPSPYMSAGSAKHSRKYKRKSKRKLYKTRRGGYKYTRSSKTQSPNKKRKRKSKSKRRYNLSKTVKSSRKIMKGGYITGSNVPFAQTYSTGGSLPGGLSALANPTPYTIMDNCIRCASCPSA